MKNIMIKSVCIIAVVSVVVLACSKNNFYPLNKTGENVPEVKFDEKGYWKIPGITFKKSKDGSTFTYYGTNSVYGAYLAGRVAHMRQDFGAAAEYYKIVMDKDAENLDVNRSTYVILTLLGNLDEAAVYAQKEIDAHTKNSLAPLIVAISDLANDNYEKVRSDISLLDDKVYTTIVNPFFYAWSYAGEKDEEKAIAAIDAVVPDKDFSCLKNYHRAMIYDYLGNKEKADEFFSMIIQKQPQEVTYRMLEVITDFYVRNGDKEKARKISKRYNDNSALAVLLDNIEKRIDNTPQNAPAVIDSAQKGMAEALFSIGTIFRMSNGGSEFAQIYISASSYLNPEYDVSKIALANILEEVGLLHEANRYYLEVNKNSGSYFIARLKLIENLNSLEQYDEAEKYLQDLLKDYPDNTQLLSSLGNIYSQMNKHYEAIKTYKQALESIKQPNNDSWVIYYALATSYDKINKKDISNEYLLKALDLSNRDPNVLNYLGYSWLVDNKNTDEAIQMILDAYKQYPYEGHIIDSLGWVYFRTGNYAKAIEYLEQAADMNPGNAVISDHLGDAYWYIGRKNEAVFQWKHALVLKEDAEMINKDIIQAKIDNGAVQNAIITVKNEKLSDELNNLNLKNDKGDNESETVNSSKK
jgi:tetratricopeptide (TPR) repeat protein